MFFGLWVEPTTFLLWGPNHCCYFGVLLADLFISPCRIRDPSSRAESFQEFQAVAGLPSVLGVLDCVQVHCLKTRQRLLLTAIILMAHCPSPPAGHHQVSQQRGLLIPEQEGLPLYRLPAGVQLPGPAPQRRDTLARQPKGHWDPGEVGSLPAAAGGGGGLAAGWGFQSRRQAGGKKLEEEARRSCVNLDRLLLQVTVAIHWGSGWWPRWTSPSPPPSSSTTWPTWPRMRSWTGPSEPFRPGSGVWMAAKATCRWATPPLTSFLNHRGTNERQQLHFHDRFSQNKSYIFLEFCPRAAVVTGVESFYRCEAH